MGVFQKFDPEAHLDLDNGIIYPFISTYYKLFERHYVRLTFLIREGYIWCLDIKQREASTLTLIPKYHSEKLYNISLDDVSKIHKAFSWYLENPPCEKDDRSEHHVIEILHLYETRTQ